MRRQLTNPSLGLIGTAGVILGLLAWWWLGSGSPLQPDRLPTPTAFATPQSTPTAEIWPLPTRPVFNWSESPLTDSQAIIGSVAPDFDLLDRAGQSVQLSDFLGKVVVVNFWASWCPPCREEMPALQAIAAQYADQDLVVLGINTTYTDSREDALEFIDELGLTIPILFDETGEVTEKEYGVVGLPVTFWIKPDGKIHSIHAGPMTLAEMTDQAAQLLNP
ncbi:TlpA family protein disulfide reductase [bacterium]|nr:TlpA family protein disulfide reductase [bacterium]